MDAAIAGTIGGTYCGNPLACASALKTMEIMKEEDFAGKARHIVECVTKRLHEMQDKYEVIGDVRGMGAMIGIEFVLDRETKEPATELVSKLIAAAFRKGLLIEGAGTYNNVIRFLAPLTMTDEQTARGLDIFAEALLEVM